MPVLVIAVAGTSIAIGLTDADASGKHPAKSVKHSAQSILRLALNSRTTSKSAPKPTPKSKPTAVATSSACAAMSTSVSEVLSPSSQATLFTVYPNEANSAGGYGYSSSLGTAFKASPKPASGLVAVHRLRFPGNPDLMLSADPVEIGSVTAAGWRDLGTSFYASPTALSCTTPVYRLQRSGIHRDSANPAEIKTLQAAGWHLGKVDFYAVPASTTSTPPVSAPPPVSTPPTPAPNTGNPLANGVYGLTVGTRAWNAYLAATDPTVKRAIYQIAATPSAYWLGGTSSDVAKVQQIESAAVALGKAPVFVLYAIPNRDCGHYSAGGLSSPSQYDAWIDSIRKAIAGRPAVVIVEPDAIGWGCLNAAQISERIGMLHYAMQTMSADPKTWVYIHASSAGQNPQGIANNLKQVGIQYARGFAVNVSSFDSTASEIAYGKSIDQALGMQKHFVVDTSRNGAGRYAGGDGYPSWCNPPGRAVGTRPTTNTGDSLVDAFLWIKTPGGSDGACRPGAPAAGQFYQSLAVDMVQRAISLGIITNLPLPN